MVGVILQLQLAAACRLVDGSLHAVGYLVGVHYNLSVHVARRSTSGLRKRAMTAQEPLLVGIKDSHKRHFGQVQSLAQKVYAYKHVVHTGTQVVHNLHAVERCHVAVYVVGAYVVGKKILGKLLRHTLRERGDKYTRVVLATLHNFLKQVVNLVLARSHFDDWVEQSGRTYNLFNHNASCLI